MRKTNNGLPNDAWTNFQVNAHSSSSSFSNFSFGAASSSTTEPPHGSSSSELPVAGFTFGTCPSTPFVGTPTAERGQFEYPDLDLGPRDVPPNQVTPQALGQAYRRGSIVSRTSSDRRPSVVPRSFIEPQPSPFIHQQASYPSLPVTRRSSTCSTIATVPSSGRRPSILHSATNPPLFPVTNGADIRPTSHRPSLMFPNKALAISVPPSLARRGSLPTAQLFGLPTADLPRSVRASFAAPSSLRYTDTASALYHRRDSESILSDSGASSSSSRTMSGHTITEANHSRRESLQTDLTNPEYSTSTSRRSSLPFLPAPPPPDSPLSTGHFAHPSCFSPSRKWSNPESSLIGQSPRRSRLSSASTRHSILSLTRSLGSSEESNEEDDDGPLPTPNSSVGSPTFIDPWAINKVSEEDEDAENLVPPRSFSARGVGVRPALETIPSDDTERGYRSP